MAPPPSQDIYAETLAVFERAEHRHEPLTTPEVATALEEKRRTVYKRLQTLVERGELETKETGSNSRVWWRSADVRAQSSDVGNAERTSHQPVDDRTPLVNYRELFDAMPDGVTLHDPADGSLLEANQEFCELLGYDREELLTLAFDELHVDEPPYTSERAKQYIRQTATEGPQTFEWLDRTKSGEPLPVEVNLRRTTIDGVDRVLAVVRDISERKRSEQELERRSRAMETSMDGMAILDADGEYVYVNEAHVDAYGYDDREEFLGEHWELCYDDEELPRFEDEIMPTLYEEGEWRGEAIGSRKDGSTFPQELSLTVTDEGGIICVVRDISERKVREQELRETARQLQGVLDTVEASIFLKDADGEYLLLNQNCRELLGLDADADIEGLTDDDFFPPDVADAYRADDDRVFEADATLEIEEEVPTPAGTRTHLTRKTPVYDDDGDPYAVCAVSTDISERKERERELERQHDQLAALNQLNDVVRGISDAVIDQSTRPEIERVVCDRLAGSDSYRYAWISAVDSGARLERRVEAGGEGGADGSPLPPAPDDPLDVGPVADAVGTREIQVVRPAADGDPADPLAEWASQHGFRSVAGVPLVHRDTLYGVLGVSSQRPDAFEADEREVIGQLGEVVGHAIAAVDRKRALMSDEVLELELRIPDLLTANGVSGRPEGAIQVERTIPKGDGEYLVYGTAATENVSFLRELTEQYPDWESIRLLEESNGEVRFEQHLTDPPMASLVAEYGGRFDGGRIDASGFFATIHLPPGTDLRRVVAGIRERYPSVETVRQRQVTRREPSSRSIRGVLAGELTDRQRAVLEAAYYAGFFEWPRDRSGEDVADSLDIGASTFHQHLRKAEKHILDAVFA